jgi:phosphohistidine phosphatase
MHRLILLRHGKAEPASASGDDFDRALTERGRREAALTGRLLAEAGLIPDLALVSAARRTRETWTEASAAFPDAQVEFSRGLYLASGEQLASVAGAAGSANVMLVGHNPGLHELALALLAESGAPPVSVRMDGFPTAAAAVFSVSASGEAEFERLVLPRDHRGGPA